MKHIKIYENFLDDIKNKGEELPEPVASEYFDKIYTDIAERTFYELDDHFHYDKNQFFPLKVSLEEYNGRYDLKIALGLGWITRMSDDDIDWLNEYVNDLNSMFKKNNNFYAVFMGDSFGGGRKIYSIQNDYFPKQPNDYLNFPKGKYPDR